MCAGCSKTGFRMQLIRRGGWSRPSRQVSPESPVTPVVHLPRLPRNLPVLSLRPLVRVLFPAIPYVEVPPRLSVS